MPGAAGTAAKVLYFLATTWLLLAVTMGAGSAASGAGTGAASKGAAGSRPADAVAAIARTMHCK